MAIVKANANTNTNAKSFEDDNSDLDMVTGAAEQETKPLTANERVAAAAAKAAAAAAPKEDAKPASTQRAVAPQGTRAVGASLKMEDPFLDLENALSVEWNTLPRIMPTNGNFQNKETQKLMGDAITVEILSIQDHYVVSPGGDIDDEEAKPFIKYSDDGITTREGESVADAIAAAVEAGYTKATCKKRMILVGGIVDGGKAPEMNGELFQMDCAPNTVKNFKQFRFSNAYQIGKGQKTAEGSNIVDLFTIVKSEKKMNWTEAGFRAHTPK